MEPQLTKMTPIKINGNLLDLNTRGFSTAAINDNDTAGSKYILIQAQSRLDQAEKGKLKELEVFIDRYVSDNTYLCRYERKDKDLKLIRDLGYWVGVYPEQAVVSASLKASPPLSNPSVMSLVRSQPQNVDIILHKEMSRKIEEVRAEIAEAAHVDGSDLEGSDRKVRVTVNEKYLADVARIEEVQTIEKVYERVLLNGVARKILNADKPVAVKFTGKGEVVAVADTGIDEDHEAFDSRIIHKYALGRPGKTDDPSGHGTHVSGSVLGDGSSAAGGPIAQGIAHQANLVMQSVLDSRGRLSGIPPDLNDLFGPPYHEHDVRVHNNSWGLRDIRVPYDASASEIDQFVNEHKDMVICFAAGNEGEDMDRNGVVDLELVGSQAAAKNCITVGASESFRPGLGVTYGQLRNQLNPAGPAPFQASPLKSDLIANNADGMVAFSNRGPTQEGRIKPDVVAPGSAILSAKSSLVTDRSDWGVSPSPKYIFDSGTSMSCPLVSGCAALIRQALRENPPTQARDLFPTAALVKGLLINGAVELKGQFVPSEAGPSPNFSAGWGRVDLSKSIILNGGQDHVAGYVDATSVRDGFTKEIQITKPGSTLKVTLVWTDPEGALLQNDLDLIVAMAGEERHGNMGTQQGFDRVNNVEQVLWQPISVGKAVIKVIPHGLTTDDQDFALVWSLT